MRMIAQRSAVVVLIGVIFIAASAVASWAGDRGLAVKSRPSSSTIETKAESEPMVQTEAVSPQEPTAAEVNWRVLSGGGGSGTAGTLRFSATIGQPIVGWTSTTSQSVHAGFWQDFGSSSCCEYRGNVDHQWTNGNPIVVSDITYLIAMVFRGGPDAPCMEEADVTADGSINVSDITYLIAHVFRGGPAPPPC